MRTNKSSEEQHQLALLDYGGGPRNSRHSYGTTCRAATAPGALRTPNEAHAALIPLLEILRLEGVITRLPAATGPIADELRSYDAHMCDARGLAPGTRTGRLRMVERLIVSKFAPRPVVFGELRTDDIRQFIAEQLDALGTIKS